MVLPPGGSDQPGDVVRYLLYVRDVEHGRLRPHHVLLHAAPHLVPGLTMGPHQALADTVLVATDLALTMS